MNVRRKERSDRVQSILGELDHGVGNVERVCRQLVRVTSQFLDARDQLFVQHLPLRHG